MFLLESHVMPPEEATTPLRRLYFAVQSMIIEPAAIVLARQIYDQQHHELIATFKDVEIQEGLMAVRGMIERTRVYEALKLIRKLFEIERRALDAANMASGRVVA
jgi:flagellar protein FlbT